MLDVALMLLNFINYQNKTKNVRGFQEQLLPVTWDVLQIVLSKERNYAVYFTESTLSLSELLRTSFENSDKP